MKFLKILLIVVLLLTPLISYGTGSITSGDKTVYFEEEEPATLNEWFYGLSLNEKIEIYNYWKEEQKYEDAIWYLYEEDIPEHLKKYYKGGQIDE